MIVIEYLSKSYNRVLEDLHDRADLKSRFFVTLNGASQSDLIKVTDEIQSETKKTILRTRAITDKMPDEDINDLFAKAKISRDILLFENADQLFEKKLAVRNSHEMDQSFNINNLFKNIANHNALIILATKEKQTLSAAMSGKVDVVIRF